MFFYHSECKNCCLCIIIIQKIELQAESKTCFQIWFFPRFGGKNGGVLSMHMQVILDSLFARPGSAPIWGGKKRGFRYWTKGALARSTIARKILVTHGCEKIWFYSHDVIDRPYVRPSAPSCKSNKKRRTVTSLQAQS